MSELARSRKPRLRQEWMCETVFRPLAHLVVVPLARLRVPPPAVVAAAAAFGIASAVELARGELVVAALLLQAKTVLDNADGQLARLTGRVTAFGRYLDAELDLVVNAALFAAIGYETGRPVLAAAGFVALTAVLSVNFNVERLARGAPVGWDGSLLGRAYAVLYGWQDRVLDRVLPRPELGTVTVLAQLGMSSQLLVLGICAALGQPLVDTWLLLVQLAAVAVLVFRPNTNQEVSLEHR
ncbi:MAG TPA: CDP-alcohol phosphatidyltransferase family protein [Gaiellaceae bacterium]|nr:CDP-alcohol phosphatidyltransferase family protein [Gaiellaceae bacterium]